MDARNKTPHVEIEGDYERLDKTVYKKSMELFRLHDDYISVDLKFDKHMTLFYKKGLLVLIGHEEINSILEKLLLNGKMVQSEQSNNVNKCCVCYENDINTIIKPCNHVGICEQCVKHTNNHCPMCRCVIESTEKVYL